MKVDIIHYEDPYKLDRIKGNKTLPALTRKNADFITAVVNLDSNYGRDLKYNQPEDGYDPEKYAENSKGKYGGSTAYWFSEMQKANCNFEKCVLGAIIAIDKTNSTRLEASEHGRKIIKNIICEKCNNYHDIIDMLKVPFKADNHNHLISLLSGKTTIKTKGTSRYNISFATKFCSYASYFLRAGVEYPKYDEIVSNALPKYISIYLGKEKKENEFKINYNKQWPTEEAKHQHRLDIYAKYLDCIKNIIDTLRTDNGIIISMEEFDHIIWYALKG